MVGAGVLYGEGGILCGVRVMYIRVLYDVRGVLYGVRVVYIRASNGVFL